MKKIYSYFLLILLILLNITYSKTEIDKAFIKRNKSYSNRKFSIYSPDIYKGREIRRNQLYNDLNCGGENISPELKWKNAPEGTKSFAIIMYTENSKKNKLWWNWVLYDIPSSVEMLSIGASNDKKLLPKGSIEAQNDYGETSYGGPCPPLNSKYSYRIIIYALNVENLGLIKKSTPAMVAINLEKYKIASAEIVSTYTGKYDNFLHKKPEDVKIIEDLNKKQKEEEQKVKEVKGKIEEKKEEEQKVKEDEEGSEKIEEKNNQKLDSNDNKVGVKKIYKFIKPTHQSTKIIKKPSLIEPLKKVSKVKTLEVELNEDIQKKEIVSKEKTTKIASDMQENSKTLEKSDEQTTTPLPISTKQVEPKSIQTQPSQTQPSQTQPSQTQPSQTQPSQTQPELQPAQPQVPTENPKLPETSTTTQQEIKIITTTPNTQVPQVQPEPQPAQPQIPVSSESPLETLSDLPPLDPSDISITTYQPEIQDDSLDINYPEIEELDLDFFETEEEGDDIFKPEETQSEENQLQPQNTPLQTPNLFDSTIQEKSRQKTEKELKQEELLKIEQDILNMNF